VIQDFIESALESAECHLMLNAIGSCLRVNGIPQNIAKEQGNSPIRSDSPTRELNNQLPNGSTEACEGENDRRYACHYWKYAPNHFKNKQSCAGIGYPNVSRLKCVNP
jgi:hypothetical protein